jgi:hypothetical protein
MARLIALLIAVVVVLGGCSAQEPTAAPTPTPTTASPTPTTATPEPPPTDAPSVPVEACVRLTKAEVAQIADGLKNDRLKVVWGVRVPLATPAKFGMQQIAAVEVSPVTVLSPAFAVGKTTADGIDSPIIAVNHEARKYFTWGAAAKSGSPIDKERDALEYSPEYAAATDCVDENLPEPTAKPTKAAKPKPWQPDTGVDWDNYAPTVKKRIDRLGKAKRCNALQKEFDTADANDAATRAETGEGNADLMSYIDEWMQHADCY